ncbi:hypothetical protein GCM10010211_13840 [Streptomyces albospinus]|uniref:DUF309 domain-containing protein n=1 Tax=Streptomyces albospinus TaxID=285515 RepID=A0ABQ2UTP6_9ACTN|nr:DUF309 domain-containing protein [Streptomyces albospinus]GGU50651.1 hypothetical protein GCM10010211_13840 [Streptomyces albospinus]
MSDPEETRHTSRDDEGGDPACWLDQVCDACGRIRERPGSAVCDHCGAEGGAGTGTDTAPAAGPGPATPGRRRDRDAQGRARNARPRDGLGRPLPYGSEGVERQPEGVARTPEESLAEAQRLLDAGMPFHAHEVLEDAWKAAPETERELWRGLAQLAVGLTHAARGNATGGAALLVRGAAAIAPYAAGAPYGIDVGGLTAWARQLAERLSGAPSGRGSDPVPAAGTAPRLRTS